MAIFIDLGLSDSGHTGISADPFSPIDFLSIANTQTGSAYFKNIYVSNASGNVGNPGLNWLCWDKSVDSNGINAAWGFSRLRACTIAGGVFEGGIIGVGKPSSTGVIQGTDFINCQLSQITSGGGQQVLSGNYKGCNISGSTISCPTGAIAQDSIITVVSAFNVSAIVLINCALVTSTFSTDVAPVDCQFNYVKPSGTTKEFKDWIDPAHASVWAGNAPYTGYEKGLNRAKRIGIGALNFPTGNRKLFNEKSQLFRR